MSMIGKTLAHYEITAPLGRGGMEEVHQAKGSKLLAHWVTRYREGLIATTSCLTLFIVILCLSLSIVRSDKAFAEEKKLTPEEVVARHLKSIGSPEVLAAVQSRRIDGITSVWRPIGRVPPTLPEPGKRSDPGNFIFASMEHKLGMVMKFYDPLYPGEHFAFDGKDVTVSYINDDRRSLLGDFIALHSGLMREGLLGGALSTAWPLLDVQKDRFKLKYRERHIEGIKFHELTYEPRFRRGLDRIRIHLFFDFETYRHVMTECVLIEDPGIYPSVSLIERFGNFKNVDGMMLPHNYSIAYADWREYYPTQWSAEVKQILHNGPIDAQLFKAR